MDNTQKVKKLRSKKLGFYLLIIGFFCILISGILGFRVINKIIHRPPPIPRETNVNSIQDWMTIPYISRTYGVTGSEVFSKLEIDQGIFKNSSLSQIAEKTGQDSEELKNKIKDIISDFQSTNKKLPSSP